ADGVVVAEGVGAGKVGEAVPGAKGTFGGTMAIEGLLLVNVTTWPFGGAAPLRVTVPVDGLPPFTVEGESVNVARLGGLTVRRVVLVTPAYDAEMVAAVEADTGEVTIWKVAEVAPWFTIALAGTLAAVVLLLSATLAPPIGADPERFTVPTEFCPPITELGFAVTELNVAGPLGGL